MAEIDSFITPEGLTRPDVQSPEERDKERLGQLQAAAEDQVNDQFEKYFDVTGVGGIGAESDFEARNMGLLFQSSIRSRIFDVLGNAGGEYWTRI